MEKKFTSLDRYFSCKTKYIEPDRYRNLLNLSGGINHIAQGSGISYVPASFGKDSQVIGMRSFDRILDFNINEKTISVEAGVTLDKLYSFLLPYKLCLPVQPGHPQITIGGCIACNVFGKNQARYGLFSSSIIEIQLYHPLHCILNLSRNENSEIFELTCGGFGLTGIIISAKLRLSPIEGDVITHNVRVGNLLDTFNVLNDLKDKADLLYTWNDLSTSGKEFGRGFIITGSFSKGNLDIKDNFKFKKLNPHKHKFSPPRIFNKVTVPFLNLLFYIQNVKIKPEQRISYFDFSYPVANKVFYFDLFGKGGFIEQQILVPKGSYGGYLLGFEKLVKRCKPLIVLCSCKAFSGRQRLLNFSGDGVVLSLDIPNLPEHKNFLNELDDLNIEFSAIGNICKDSRISKEVVSRQYKEYNEFRSRLHNFDPKRLFISELSKRLDL